MSRIEFHRTQKTLECDLSHEERQLRSDEAHALTQSLIMLERERDKYKSEVTSTTKEIERVAAKHRGLSIAAGTGKESRDVDVVLVYDTTTDEVLEQRDDTGATLVRRKPYAAERPLIERGKQQPLPLTLVPLQTPPQPAAPPTVGQILDEGDEPNLIEKTEKAIEGVGHTLPPLDEELILSKLRAGASVRGVALELGVGRDRIRRLPKVAEWLAEKQ